MAKMNKNIIIGIVIIAIFVIINGNFNIGTQAILSPGEYNPYPNEATCTFTTNVDDIDDDFGGGDNFQDNRAWILVDADFDGIKDAYGWASNTQGLTSPAGACTGHNMDHEVLASFASDGKAMYQDHSGGRDILYVCSGDKRSYTKFFKDYSNADEAVDCTGGGPVCGDGTCDAGETAASCPQDCGPGCTPDSSCATITCIGSTCSDSCQNEYPGTLDCSGGECTMANLIAQGPITRNDLGSAITSWVNG